MQADIDTLARTIYGEARGESFIGQVAVAWVVRNRSMDATGRWGSSIKDVCLRPKQFRCWNSNDPQYHTIRSVGMDSVAFVRALAVAALVILGDLADPTDGADHYCTLAVHPPWRAAMRVTTTIGHHVFLKS
jgi:N-acetylmuramoyl-L-alanine amidase